MRRRRHTEYDPSFDLYNNDKVQFEDVFGDTQHQLEATRIFTGIFEVKCKIEDEIEDKTITNQVIN